MRGRGEHEAAITPGDVASLLNGSSEETDLVFTLNWW